MKTRSFTSVASSGSKRGHTRIDHGRVSRPRAGHSRGRSPLELGLVLGLGAVASLGCVSFTDDPGVGDLAELDGEATGAGADDAHAGPGGLAAAPQTASGVTQACIDAPSPAICCTGGELITEGTELGDVVVLDPLTAHCAFGYGGNDAYTGGPFRDILAGGPSADTLYGGDDDDTLLGGPGNDTLEGEGGKDTIHGSDGADVLRGGEDGDRLYGGSGADVLEGGSGDDVLVGGMDSDMVYGESGDDVIIVHHVCELGTGELIDGGTGHDIVVAPVDKAGLLALGVQLVNVEQIVVDGSKGHLAECGPPPEEGELAHALTMRNEVALGCARRIPGKYSLECMGDDGFAMTRARGWVDVPETTTKFLATHDDATAAITFSALAVGNYSAEQLHARSPIHVRVLIDGVPVEFGAVDLVFSGLNEPTAYTFAARNVSRGIHNVRFQWHIDDDLHFAQWAIEPIARIHGANVSVIVDSPHTEVAGAAGTGKTSLSVAGPLGTIGPWKIIDDPASQGPLTVLAYVNEGATTTVTLSAEVFAAKFATLDVRAKVDGSTTPLAVNEVRFAQRMPVPYWGTAHPEQDQPQGLTSRGFTFVAEGLDEGWHKFTFEGRVRVEGTPTAAGEFEEGNQVASLHTRSAVVVSTVDDPIAGVAVAVATADDLIVGLPEELEVIDGLQQSIDVAADSQVLVHFDADVRDLWVANTYLLLDGVPVPESERQFLLETGFSSGTLTTDYVLKRLPAGTHELAIAWEGPTGTPASELTRRSMTIRTEPLHTPDLGRGPDFGAGANGTTFNRNSVQALDGKRKVLPILIDPERPEVKRVYFTDDVAGTYTLKVDGTEISYSTGPGESIEHVIQALVDGINAEDLVAEAEVIEGDLQCADCNKPNSACSGCVGELWVEGKSLGENLFTLSVEETQVGTNGDVMQWRLLSNAPIPIAGAIQDMIFGLGSAAASDAYWLQQSRGLLELEPAYAGQTGVHMIGPLTPGATGVAAVKSYWQRPYTETCNLENGDTYPFRGGHQRRYWEGLLQADEDVNFADFDVDGDGTVRNDELMIVFITPQQGTAGFRRDFQPFCLDEQGEPELEIELDGVNLDFTFLELYSGNGTNGYKDHALISHELSHYFGVDDMYIKYDSDNDGVADVGCRNEACTEHEAWAKSIMDATTYHDLSDHHWSELDGVHKLAYGWVTPRMLVGSTSVSLEPVTSGREVLILPRPGSGGREYFLVENRVNRSSINGGYDVDIGPFNDDGLAVWHVVEPEMAEYWEFDGGTPLLGCWENPAPLGICRLTNYGQQCPTGPTYAFDDRTESFVRRSVRLVRSGPSGSAFENGSGALWNDTTGDLESDGPSCGPGVLTWSDGFASAYRLTQIGPAGSTMTLCVEVDGVPCA